MKSTSSTTSGFKVSRLFKDFFESEKAGGFVLIACTVISLILANSNWGEQYHHFWLAPLAGKSIEYWINDGLMAIFFLLIGLELEREVYIGELSAIKNALLPLSGAFGGMLIPAAIYLLFNYGTGYQSGAGIPMATDIAFALGILSLLGKRVPTSLKVFLTALAVIDDLGAILVIAIFYSGQLSWFHLGIAGGIFAVLLVLNRLKIRNLIPYLIGGVAMWYFMLHSGVHATITGVLVAFAIPFGSGGKKSTSYLLQHALHRPVAFFILPLFALANTAIVIHSGWVQHAGSAAGLGILLGLLLGKPLGIVLFSFIAIQLGICALPGDLKWKQLAGAGVLGGIGFTMSIFITLLAFQDNELINYTKMMILIASLLASIIGYLVLYLCLPKAENREETITAEIE